MKIQVPPIPDLWSVCWVGVCRPASEAMHRDAAEHQAAEAIRLGAGGFAESGGDTDTAAESDAQGGRPQGFDK